MTMNRREFLLACSDAAATASLPSICKASPARGKAAKWISTTKDRPWHDLSARLKPAAQSDPGLFIESGTRFQTVDGFGACFNELGWEALSRLREDQREEILADFFAPGGSLQFTRCRMPVAANDFSVEWYSYNEMPGDFGMSDVSIDHDRKSLVPYIQAAQVYQPELTLWASPWSPPTWMKTNGHYAQRMSSRSQPDAPDNGLKPAQVVNEGENGFIVEEEYFTAYALYIRKFLEAYRRLSIPIDVFMPQNEWNSSQVFPSCVWRPEALAKFIPFLGDQIGPLDVDIFLGTLERPDPRQFEAIYEDPACEKLIKGFGLQWAGRGAAPFLGRNHPDLKFYQTEQECGDGKNDWRYAKYTWELMKDYFTSGVNVYHYWNMALTEGEPSTWGWRQNSLVTVSPDGSSYNFMPDYYLFKHLSHFLKPGTQRIQASSYAGYDNLLAIQNPDDSTVVVYQNAMCDPLELSLQIDDTVVSAVLSGDSINTLVV